MRQLYVALLMLVVMSACSGGGGGGNDQVVDEVIFTEDPAIYAKKPTPETVIKVITPSGDLDLPVTLILFSFDETVDADQAKAVIEGQGGVLAGQIPAMGIYQGEFTSLTGYDDLNNKINDILSQSIPGLRGVSFDAFAEPLEAGEEDTDLEITADLTLENCHVTDDNMWMGPRGRCPLENAEYFQLIAIMDNLKDDVPLAKVRVGVMDTGIDGDYGEFDDITLVNIDAPGTVATDTDPGLHGTKVASIIAADDDGEGMNGIASKVLGDKLIIGATSFRNKTVSGELATLAQMAKNGFSIVNMSFGYDKSKYTEQRYAEIRSMYKTGLAALPQVLFVAAAANESFELTRDNDCPAGIDLPNVITVGGLSNCDIDEAASFSSYGDLIDMAAPAVRVPCVSTLGRSKVAGSVGNSFAAPQVTAVAAILKSIDPSISASAIKTHLQYSCLGTTADMGYRRLVYALPVTQLLTDVSVSDAVLDLVDRDEDDEADPSGIIVNRICSGIEYRIETEGGASFDGTYRVTGDEEELAGALLGSRPLSIWSIGSMEDEAPPLLSMFCSGCEFAIFGHSFAVDDSGNNVTLSIQPDEEHAGIIGTGGIVYFDNCQVLQRFALGDFDLPGGIPGLEDIGNTPSLISVEGRFQASGEILMDDEFKSVSISGTFVSPLAITPTGVNEDLLNYIETNCLCGTGVE